MSLTSLFSKLAVSIAGFAICVTSLGNDILRVPKDYATIQAAIDAAASGDTVLVERGTYRERLQLKPGVTLKSAGDNTRGKLGLKRAETTILDGGQRQGKRAGVSMGLGATLDGFTVTNVGVYDDDLWKKHHATQGEEQSHEHIGEWGIAGIEVTGVACTIENNIVHHNGYTGIAIRGPCSPRVSHNVCYRNMGGGIGSMKKSTAMISHNTCFENFYAGIGHDDASPTVVDNSCYANVRAGIGISHGACPIVRGNRCFRNRRAGIGSRTGNHTRPIIEDNDCYENEMAGIGASEEAAPTIRNNRCFRNKLAGIGSRTGAQSTIVGNECYENGKVGIGQQSGATTVLIDNHCHHNKAAGIGFDKCESGRSTVINNRVIDNALVAVGIQPGWRVTLSNNELSRSKGLPPIVMVFAGAEATLTKNKIRGGGVAAIRVAGTVQADRNQLGGIAVRQGGPPNFAVWALPGANVRLTSNQIHTWRHARSPMTLSSSQRITQCVSFIRKRSSSKSRVSRPPFTTIASKARSRMRS